VTVVSTTKTQLFLTHYRIYELCPMFLLKCTGHSIALSFIPASSLLYDLEDFASVIIHDLRYSCFFLFSGVRASVSTCFSCNCIMSLLDLELERVQPICHFIFGHGSYIPNEVIVAFKFIKVMSLHMSM
jgi:hypothetical protein